jgi:hypothetical protein
MSVIKFENVGKRLRSRRTEAYFNLFFGLLIIGFTLSIIPFRSNSPAPLFLVIGVCFLGGSALGVFLSQQLPTKEIMLLAQSRNGLLTLSEITTTLDIDPALAARALKKLQKLQIASPRWQDYRKNLWEFPDYVQLPLEQSIELARQSGGRLTLKALLAQGHSLDTAQQTLDTLSREGLAQPEPGHAGSVLLANA